MMMMDLYITHIIWAIRWAFILNRRTFIYFSTVHALSEVQFLLQSTRMRNFWIICLENTTFIHCVTMPQRISAIHLKFPGLHLQYIWLIVKSRETVNGAFALLANYRLLYLVNHQDSSNWQQQVSPILFDKRLKWNEILETNPLALGSTWTTKVATATVKIFSDEKKFEEYQRLKWWKICRL